MMRNNLLAIIAVAVLINLCTVMEASAARIPISYGTKEKIVKIHDLPKTEEYKLRGKSFDLGYMYKTYEVMWVPLHAKDGKIVGYIDDSNYVSIDKEGVEYITANNKITNLSSIAKIPFWDAWGGKLLVGGIVLCIIFFMIKGRNSDEESASANNDQQPHP